MPSSMLCISHDSALYYWRTNPPWYVLEGGDRNIRSLRGTPTKAQEYDEFHLSEMEFGPDPIDILVPSNTPYAPSRFRRHAQYAQLPRHALYPIRDGIHVVSPELCLVELCRTLPFIDALELGMEFCGTYARRDYDEDRMAPRDYRLVDAQAFRRHLRSWESVKGLAGARKVAGFLENGAASPMETKTYLLLCLPQRYGGYNLPRPLLNPEVPLTPAGSLLLRKDKVYPDLLWKDAKLVVEYDGKYHDYGGQPVSDEMRKTVLESMGYTVMQLKYEQVNSRLALDGVADAIAKALGKRMRPLSLSQEHARDELRRKLLGKAFDARSGSPAQHRLQWRHRI